MPAVPPATTFLLHVPKPGLAAAALHRGKKPRIPMKALYRLRHQKTHVRAGRPLPRLLRPYKRQAQLSRMQRPILFQLRQAKKNDLSWA